MRPMDYVCKVVADYMPPCHLLVWIFGVICLGKPGVQEFTTQASQFNWAVIQGNTQQAGSIIPVTRLGNLLNPERRER